MIKKFKSLEHKNLEVNISFMNDENIIVFCFLECLNDILRKKNTIMYYIYEMIKILYKFRT